MKQGHSACRRIDEVDRDAIGNRYSEEDAGAVGCMTVNSLEQEPPARLAVPGDPGSVHLDSQDAGGKPGERRSKRPPAAHGCRNRCLAPEPQIERRRRASSPGDAGDDAELAPRLELEARDGPRLWDLAARGFAQSSRRSIDAPSSRSRTSMCSYPRSICPTL